MLDTMLGDKWCLSGWNQAVQTYILHQKYCPHSGRHLILTDQGYAQGTFMDKDAPPDKVYLRLGHSCDNIWECQLSRNLFIRKESDRIVLSMFWMPSFAGEAEHSHLLEWAMCPLLLAVLDWVSLPAEVIAKINRSHSRLE